MVPAICDRFQHPHPKPNPSYTTQLNVYIMFNVKGTMRCKRASKVGVCVFCRCIGMYGRSKGRLREGLIIQQAASQYSKIAIQSREKIQSTSLNKMMFSSISVFLYFPIRGQTKQQLAFRVPVAHLSYVVQTCLYMRLS